MVCGILYFGGRLVLGQGINLAPSVFLTYIIMFYNIINPAKTLSTSFSNMQKGSAAITRIEEVLKASITVDDNPNGKKCHVFDSLFETGLIHF